MTQVAQSIRKIEQELAGLLAEASDEYPLDVFAVGIVARKLGAQAEMLEQGLDG